ncbi:MAG: Exoenzymes regulatory protein AepA precursor [uncultured Cytophagales bacterium]|uniref:Exoenzymes regulatory protein AepA n=1 Tax=uncultured Cytophagales bacterium TaxID=158755 RepID=A0A6J4LCP8_9SPHI|nr:MAG: Exoenzymes regulatory protein AepA precursor [uncultured Cytophagales bacterium]
MTPRVTSTVPSLLRAATAGARNAGLVLLLLLSGFAHAQTGRAAKADLIIRNGKILTLDEGQAEASAVAIRDGKFVRVGTDKDVMAYRGAQTRVIDAGGRRIVPGLNDSHIHVIRGGRFYNLELRWDGVKSLKAGLDMIREQAKRTPAGQWVRVVGGWSEYQFAERRLPTLEEINEVAPNTPVFVLCLYGKAFLNKAALAAAGITRDAPNPPGGLIDKDEHGEPTGLLVAEPNAFILYSTLAKGPVLSFEDQLNSTRQFMRDLNRFGLTSAVDAGGGFQNYPDDYATTDTLARRGQLTLRIPYYLFAQKGGQELQDYGKWIALADLDHQDGKLLEQGYSLEGGGENLVAAGADFENFRVGRPQLAPGMEGQLKEVVGLLVKNRWPFRLHATYDESITRFLDVLEAVHAETPFNGLRWYFDHAETVSEQNLRRVKALGGGIAVQNRMSFQGESFVSRYGRGAAQATPPFRRMIEMGIPVAMGTDATRVSSYNPWVALHWLVTGKTLGGTALYPKENLLDRTQALRLYTLGSAALTGEADVKGAIKAGQLADLAMLTADYLSVPEDDIPGIESVLTLLGGKVVYGKGEYEKLAPPPLPVSPAWSPAAAYNGWGGAPKGQ